MSLIVIVTFTILNIIHCPVFYLKHNVSETGFRLCLQVEYTQSDPVDGECNISPGTETSSIYWAQLSRYNLKTETNSSP
jgi:hypothetical protein